MDNGTDKDTLFEYKRFVTMRSILLGASITLSFFFCIINDDTIYLRTAFVSFVMAALWAADYFHIRWNGRYAFWQTSLTTATILTGVVYVTGNTASPFVTLYLPAVMLFALSSSQFETLLFAALGGGFYGLLIALVGLQLIPDAHGQIAPLSVPGGLWAHFLGLYSALVLVAVGTRYLVRHARAGYEKAEESSLALKELSAERSDLIERLQTVEDQLELQDRMARLLRGEEVSGGGIQTRIQDFIGESQIMQKVFELISRVAPTEATTLVSGESGTGKELVARAIHLASKRSQKRFVTVNCGAIPENLLESELFGHKKGSFTGAIADHAGLFQEADGGTLFLDEIGELPLAMQAKLLRALQEKMIRPVGSAKDIEVDVRILAATNRNLKQEVIAGRFREDLFYRLNVISLHIPALRERKEDVPFLVNSLLKSIVGAGQMPVLPPTTMKLLSNYDYPGNVRELENMLERAYVLGGDVILPEHLPDYLGGDAAVVRPAAARNETVIIESQEISFPINLDEVLETVEKKYLELALEQSKGAKKKAADLLGINFRSFRYRLSKFSITEDDLSD